MGLRLKFNLVLIVVFLAGFAAAEWQRRQSARPVDIPPEELAILEHTLSKFIGPMAKMLIREQPGHGATLKELAIAVAGNISHPQQREVFLQALRRALPHRQF